MADCNNASTERYRVIYFTRAHMYIQRYNFN